MATTRSSKASDNTKQAETPKQADLPEIGSGGVHPDIGPYRVPSGNIHQDFGKQGAR